MKDNRGNSFEVKINQSTRTSSEKTSSMSIDVGFKNEFITVGAGYQSTSMKLSTSFKEFVLIVGAASYKYIPVFPDRSWFSPEVVCWIFFELTDMFADLYVVPMMMYVYTNISNRQIW